MGWAVGSFGAGPRQCNESGAGSRKKLRRAVRHALSSDGAASDSEDVDQELRKQWQLLGVDPDKAQAARPVADEDESEDIELSPTEWRAWEVFHACWSNWRLVVGLGVMRYQGLDYVSVEAAMRMLGVPQKHHRTTFILVRSMESEARKWLNRE